MSASTSHLHFTFAGCQSAMNSREGDWMGGGRLQGKCKVYCISLRCGFKVNWLETERRCIPTYTWSTIKLMSTLRENIQKDFLQDDLTSTSAFRSSSSAFIITVIESIHLDAGHSFHHFLSPPHIIDFTRELGLHIMCPTYSMMVWAWSFVSWMRTPDWFVLWSISLFGFLSSLF